MVYKKIFNDIRKGLGSVYYVVSNDLEKYKETVLYSILHNCTDNFIFEGSKGYYLYDLILLYDDVSYFINPVKELLSKTYNRDLFAQCIDILVNHYYDNNPNIKEFIYDFYKDMVRKKYFNRNKILCFEYLCIVLYDLYGKKIIDIVLNDVNKIGIHHDDLSWFMSIINYKDLSSSDDYEKIEYKYNFTEFLEMIKNNKFCYCLAQFGNTFENEKCMDFLNMTNDLDLINKILDNYQSYRLYNNKIKATYIFKLLSLVSKFNDDIDYKVYDILSCYKHKEIERLGLSLINNPKFLKIGIKMLITNYHKKYNDLLINSYKKIKFSFKRHEDLVGDISRFMNSVKKDLPDELLFISYKENYCSFCRLGVVKALRRRNLLTKDLIIELKYDSNYEIRKYARRLK